MPALPALALLIGGWLQRDTDSGTSRTARGSGATSSVILLVIGAAAFVVGVFFVVASNTPAPGTDLAELLKKNPQDYALSFGHVFDITPQAVGAFHRPLLGISLAFLLGTGLNWIFRRHGQPARGNAALALMMVVILGCVHAAFVTFSPVLSSQQLAVAIRKYYRPGDVVGMRADTADLLSRNWKTQTKLVTETPQQHRCSEE